jgi:DNA-binding beta-propeller fold protein YncE
MQLRRLAALTLGLGLTACVQTDDALDSSQQKLDEFFRGGELWVAGQANGIERVFDDVADPDGGLGLANAGPHITTFPASQQFAYIGGMLDGKVYVIDANKRKVLKTIQVGPTLAHQVKPSPDGTTLLVSVLATKQVVKIAANEAAQTWSVVGSVSTEAFGKPPICTIFRNDGNRAYVSLNPSGIAIVDVPTMTIIGSLDTDGFVACGMIKSADGSHASVAASGSGGHIYTLDLTNDTLTDRGTLGAPSWHSWITTADETRGFGTSPLSDDVIVADLTTTPVTKLGSIHFDTIPGAGNDQPDAVGGGEQIGDKSVLPVSLRAAGKIALVDTDSLAVLKTIDIAAPSSFNPATCQGCAVHGVTVRKLSVTP